MLNDLGNKILKPLHSIAVQLPSIQICGFAFRDQVNFRFEASKEQDFPGDLVL